MSSENMELMRRAAYNGIQLSFSSPIAFDRIENHTLGILLDFDCERSTNLLKTVSCNLLKTVMD